jgi:uncharacterized protein
MTELKRSISLDLRIVSTILFVIIVGMLSVWRPWMQDPAGTKEVQVTGEATLTATPDEFTFTPSYTFENADKTAALASLTTKNSEVVGKLKEMGVPEEKIKTNAGGYDYPIYTLGVNGDSSYTLQLTVVTNDASLSQKIADYLVSTTPTGSVTPQATLSEEKRKKLESQARVAASKDARAKADEYAANLGFKVSKVKSVTDSQGFGIMPYAGVAPMAAESGDVRTSSLTIHPGQNDLNYSVTVTYSIR